MGLFDSADAEILYSIPLGVKSDGSVVTWNTLRENALLACGPAGSGKSMLLRTMLVNVSAAGAGWQIAMVDGRNTDPALTFDANEAVVVHVIVSDASIAAVMLDSIVHEVEHRLRYGYGNRILLMVDDADALVQRAEGTIGNEIVQMLRLIIEKGLASGINTVVTLTDYQGSKMHGLNPDIFASRIATGVLMERDRWWLFHERDEDRHTLDEQVSTLGRSVIVNHDRVQAYQSFNLRESEAEVFLRSLENSG